MADLVAGLEVLIDSHHVPQETNTHGEVRPKCRLGGSTMCEERDIMKQPDAGRVANISGSVGRSHGMFERSKSVSQIV